MIKKTESALRHNNLTVQSINTFVYFLLVFAFTGFSCSKSSNDPPVKLVNEFILPDPAQFGTPLSQVPSIADIQMYEVNFRVFGSSSQFQKVINRLDQIKALGINVLWLMPVYEQGVLKSVGSPYCVKNYRAVNQEFGTFTDLQNLVEQAHMRGMAVILDWVANHTAWDNPWLKYQSWYTRVDGQVISPAGTNWTDVADLNFDSQDMRLAMISAMKYWVLAANADGFRCDAADMVPFDFWKQAIDSLNALPGRNIIMLAEGARPDHFTAGFQMNYAWNFYGALKQVFNGQPASLLLSVNQTETAGLPVDVRKLRFTTNHDESAWDATPVQLFGGTDGALAASVITLFMGGNPLIYSSQEVGQAETVSFFNNNPVNWLQNPGMLQKYQLLLNYRAQSEPAKRGSLVGYDDDLMSVFIRRTADEDLLVLANVTRYEVNYRLPDDLKNTAWTDAFTGSAVNLGSNIQMGTYGYQVLHRWRIGQ